MTVPVAEAAGRVGDARSDLAAATDDVFVSVRENGSSSDLAAALEALASKLDRIEDILMEPRDPVSEIRRLADPGPVTVVELRARGYTALQLLLADVKGISEIPAMLDGGYKWSDLLDAFPTEADAAAACEQAHVPPSRLTAVGAPSDIFVDHWVAADSPEKLKELHDLGMTLDQVVKAGAKPKTLLDAGVPPKALIEHGVTGDQLLEAGLTPKQVTDAGVSPASFVIPKGTRIRLPKLFWSERVFTVEEGDPAAGYKLSYKEDKNRPIIEMETRKMLGHGLMIL